MSSFVCPGCNVRVSKALCFVVGIKDIIVRSSVIPSPLFGFCCNVCVSSEHRPRYHSSKGVSEIKGVFANATHGN